MSKFDLRSVIRQEVTKALKRRGGHAAEDEITRLQRSKSLAAAFGFGDAAFQSYEKSKAVAGPGHGHGFMGPGFKK